MNEPVSTRPESEASTTASRKAWPHALRDAAVGLALDDHGIHRPADVVHGGVARDFDNAGLRIDLQPQTAQPAGHAECVP
jgi:hypothetical protein